MTKQKNWVSVVVVVVVAAFEGTRQQQASKLTEPATQWQHQRHQNRIGLSQTEMTDRT